MTEQEIFRAKAKDGYTVCFAGQCPLKERSLRFLVGQYIPDTRSTYHCVNLHYQNVATEHCTPFRNSEEVNCIYHIKQITNA